MTGIHPDWEPNIVAPADLHLTSTHTIESLSIWKPNVLGVMKLSEDAMLPTKGHEDDAGWDLYAAESVTIHPGQTQLISTMVALQIPKGFVGLIWPRSGLSVNSGIDVLAGVIDCGYQGEVSVCLLNTSSPVRIKEQKTSTKGARLAPAVFRPDDKAEFVPAYDNVVRIEKGDRIAQILIQSIGLIPMVEIFELEPSDRAGDGYGSTGR
jgi:dUTP pyrophosphatase